MSQTVFVLACMARAVYGRRVHIADKSSQLSEQRSEPREVDLASSPSPIQELLNQKTGDLPAAFFAGPPPLTREQLEKQLEAEREKVNKLRANLAAANREVSQVAPLSKNLKLSESKNKDLMALVTEMKQIVEEGKKAKEQLNTTELAFATTKQTLQVVLDESVKNKQKLEALTELKVKIEGGDNILANELAIAKAEILRLRAKENELNVKLQIRDDRLTGIRNKAVKSMQVLANNNGETALNLSVPTIEETKISRQKVALETFIRETKEEESKTALLLGQTGQKLAETEQKLDQTEQQVLEAAAKTFEARNETANVTMQLQAQIQKTEAAEKMAADLDLKLQKTELELREEKESASKMYKDLRRTILNMEEEQDQLREDLRQTIVGKDNDLAKLRERLNEARQPKGVRRAFLKFRQIFAPKPWS